MAKTTSGSKRNPIIDAPDLTKKKTKVSPPKKVTRSKAGSASSKDSKVAGQKTRQRLEQSDLHFGDGSIQYDNIIIGRDWEGE